MDTKNKILLISRISLWVIAITAIVISIRAINIAKKRPITYEQIMIQSHDIDFTPDLTFAGEVVPLEMFNIRERYERELLSNCYFHSNTMLLLKRAKRWFPVIEPILEKYNIPDDFKYLCLVESGLTNAKSPAGAVGFWQFMPATAKEYGLTINKEIDMRYSVEAETVAACKYFQKAYKRFNNWTLAAASFNAGSSRIAKSLKEQKTNSYYDLLLNEETERYVFRVLALKTIFENPEKYGIFVSEELGYKPFRYKTVTVTKNIDSWADFAEEHGITYKLLKVFNPWLRSKSLKVGKGEVYEIKIPKAPFDITHKDYEDMLGKHNIAIYKDSINDTIIY